MSFHLRSCITEAQRRHNAQLNPLALYYPLTLVLECVYSLVVGSWGSIEAARTWFVLVILTVYCLIVANSQALIKIAVALCYLLPLVPFYFPSLAISALFWSFSFSLLVYHRSQNDSHTIAQLLYQFVMNFSFARCGISFDSEDEANYNSQFTEQVFVLGWGYHLTVLLTSFRFTRQSRNHLEILEGLRIKAESAEKLLESQTSQNKRLQEGNRVFRRAFSHEFKNNLNGIQGALESGSKKCDSATRTLLEKAQACASSLQLFATNYLLSESLESESLKLNREVTDMSRFLQNSWRLISGLIKQKNLDAIMYIDRRIPRILQLDSEIIYQVMMNLVSNSVKSTSKGSVCLYVDWIPSSLKKSSTEEKLNTVRSHIVKAHSATFEASNSYTDESNIKECNELVEDERVDLPPPICAKMMARTHFVLTTIKATLARKELLRESSTANEGYIKISVADTGIGMNKDQLAKLFTRPTNNTSQETRSLSLGLWTSHKLLRLMNGDLTYKPKAGVGLVFTGSMLTRPYIRQTTAFSSPLPHYQKPSLVQEQRSMKNNTPNSLTGSLTPNSPKVLIADDDNFNLDLLTTHLKKLGREVLSAQNGEELVQLYKQNHQAIDLVLTDNYMPKLKGIDAALEIKKFVEHYNLTRCPVHLVTGDCHHTLPKNYKAYGVVSIVTKPLSRDKVRRIVSNVDFEVKEDDLLSLLSV